MKISCHFPFHTNWTNRTNSTEILQRSQVWYNPNCLTSKPSSMPSFQAPSRPVLVHPPASPGCVMRGPLLLLVPSGRIKLDDLIQTICQQASGWFDGRRVSSNIFHIISHHENGWCCFPSYFATPFHPSIERNHLFWGPCRTSWSFFSRTPRIMWIIRLGCSRLKINVRNVENMMGTTLVGSTPLNVGLKFYQNYEPNIFRIRTCSDVWPKGNGCS